MGNDDRVLSQAEIDALLSSSAASTPAPKAAAAPVQQVKVSAAPPPPKVEAQQMKAPPPPKAAAPEKPAETAPAPHIVQQGPTPEQVTNLCRQIIAEQTRELSKQIIELTIKAKDTEKTNQRITELENKIDEMSELVKSSPRAVRALGARIDEIYSLLESIRGEKRQSDEERIRDQFRCVNCNSEKLVAMHVKCTNCGTENWMGWFPEKKGKKENQY